ncbi:MAG: dTDP-4-dehydrorhamnose 3,5-epimerase [Bacteroidales bacterium]
MKIIDTEIPEVKIIQPKIFGDHRGYFAETYREDIFKKEIGNINFVQDNESSSLYGVLRGLHSQKDGYAQAKLVRVIVGEVLDVAVDIRPNSPTFKQHVAAVLSEKNKHQMYVPRGFAHGFVVLSDYAVFSYKCDNYYYPDQEMGIKYNDPELAIDWRIPSEDIKLSEKDKKNYNFSEIKW